MQAKPGIGMHGVKGQGAASSSLTKKSKNQTSEDMLPEIGHKFSSWAKEDQNLNELDELLAEHDLMAEPV